MISVDEALTKTLALARVLPTEIVPLSQAFCRYLSKPVLAQRDQPPFDASAMDGYAISTKPLVGDTFTVTGEAGAGHAFGAPVAEGEAVRIFTGAPLPEGAVSVVLQEDVTRVANQIVIVTASTNTNIRDKGCDFHHGSAVLPKRLTANDVALLAAMNIAAVPVVRRPIVAILANGDELVMPGENPGPDQIVASNIFALQALAQTVGAEARLLPIARDTEASLAAVFDLAKGADLIVTVGGASVGDHDLVAKVAQSQGLSRAFYKIAMRPGKPLMAGTMGNIPMLGLPGNPVSAIVCAHLFMLPLLRAMQGDSAPEPQYQQGKCAKDIAANGPRTHYMRARLQSGSSVRDVDVFDDQDSSLLSILTQADALLVRPPNDGARKAGELATFLAL